MKQFLALAFFSAPFFAFSQHNATEVMNAEKSFAAFAVQNGMKDAFLNFADSTGLVFERGKPVNAIAAWTQRPAQPGILNWYPAYGFLAASGDLGFTTGPWTYQPKTISDSVVARGQFNTVWHKTAGGEWKYLLDMGVSKTPEFSEGLFRTDRKKISFTPGSLENLLQAEAAFVQATTAPTSRAGAYAKAVSRQNFVLARNNRVPTTAVADVATIVGAMPEAISYAQEGSGIAQSGDLGYVYGTSTINGKADNYLRIWRREGREWKLALEVLQY